VTQDNTPPGAEAAPAAAPGRTAAAASAGRNLVVLCDGTANHLGRDLSHVARLFRCLRRGEAQRAFYNSGVGTVGGDMWWSRRLRAGKALFEQASGYAIDRDIIAMYGYICANYAPGDRLYLFGFSRGAYSVRIVASLLHMVGVLPPDQLNLAGYALSYLKQISERNGKADWADFERVYTFGRIAGAKRATLHFLGLFDTVSSVILPGRNGIFPGLATLPYTRVNPSVEVVRHACAIDERRVMFRLNRWEEPQPFQPNPYAPLDAPPLQDVKQVWFAGNHSDVGGGYPEADAGLAKIPLLWMLREAQAQGLAVNPDRVARYVTATAPPEAGAAYAKPDPLGPLHDALTGASHLFELLPRASRFAETRTPRGPFYFPLGEPRALTRTRPRPLVHHSVVDRIAGGNYHPVNLPADYDIEP